MINKFTLTISSLIEFPSVLIEWRMKFYWYSSNKFNTWVDGKPSVHSSVSTFMSQRTDLWKNYLRHSLCWKVRLFNISSFLFSFNWVVNCKFIGIILLATFSLLINAAPPQINATSSNNPNETTPSTTQLTSTNSSNASAASSVVIYSTNARTNPTNISAALNLADVAAAYQLDDEMRKSLAIQINRFMEIMTMNVFTSFGGLFGKDWNSIIYDQTSSSSESDEYEDLFFD